MDINLELLADTCMQLGVVFFLFLFLFGISKGEGKLVVGRMEDGGWRMKKQVQGEQFDT